MIVTISRDYGAAGLAVAEGVAHELGYELLLDDLPRTVAARLGTSPDEVAERAASEASLAERILARLGAGTAEVISLTEPRLPGDFDESVRREIERTIRERAASGNVVILGRNGGALLGARPDLVRVFLTGDREWRLARIVESFGNSRARAAADLERIDGARRKIAKERYNVAWGEARCYDVLLNASRFGVDGTVELVVAAVRAAERKPT